MKRSLQGDYISITTTGEKAEAFIPHPLPPSPGIEWTPKLLQSFDSANLALGRLDSASTMLPSTTLFLYTYIKKEAVLSSMIEGTQSSLSDLLLYEINQDPSVPLADVQEVSNYVAALEHGIKRLSEGFPLSLRLIREIHEILLARGRGSLSAPGEFRRSQNWIGGTSPSTAYFVPPPAEFVQKCLGELEHFLHDSPQATSPLLKAALAHVQFETIHPFLDGNGRIGRLLITLILCEQKVLQQPLLYISLYFKTHRMYYYELLNNVRTIGDWESWLLFFAEAVTDTATQAVQSINLLAKMAEKNKQAIGSLGRAMSSAQILHQAMLQRPIVSANWLVDNTKLTPATVNKSLTHLESLGIVKQLGDKKRNRMFAYTEYMQILGI
ncbi:Fic family protein [Desulfovibrio litoralis]|uniref:Fic family protein n=1 Tax=Desulfovibrio litoralis DSM 11393 TaxID=1121455 RepID=A0A1M7TL71_9BACT|nr:Fic family protein [Desulfovibrio litoralis]SHN71446.1 Fic family protein [Desulfovibrio litoralis DSM 11393]